MTNWQNVDIRVQYILHNGTDNWTMENTENFLFHKTRFGSVNRFQHQSGAVQVWELLAFIKLWLQISYSRSETANHDFKLYTILHVLIQACMYVYLPDSFTIMKMVNASMMRDCINICYLQKNNKQNNISTVEEDEIFSKSWTFPNIVA